MLGRTSPLFERRGSKSVGQEFSTSKLFTRPPPKPSFPKVYPCRSYCVQLAKTCANNVVEWQELCRSIGCPPTDEECMPGPYTQASLFFLFIYGTSSCDVLTGRGGTSIGDGRILSTVVPTFPSFVRARRVCLQLPPFSYRLLCLACLLGSPYPERGTNQLERPAFPLTFSVDCRIKTKGATCTSIIRP